MPIRQTKYFTLCDKPIMINYFVFNDALNLDVLFTCTAETSVVGRRRPRGDAASLVVVLTTGAPLLCPGCDSGRRSDVNCGWVYKVVWCSSALKISLGTRSAPNICRPWSPTVGPRVPVRHESIPNTKTFVYLLIFYSTFDLLKVAGEDFVLK